MCAQWNDPGASDENSRKLFYFTLVVVAFVLFCFVTNADKLEYFAGVFPVYIQHIPQVSSLFT